MSDVFLSYKREDQAIAREVAADLEAEGFSVFFDARIDVGDSWDEAIERELAAARATVVLWSPRSRESKWVKREARESLARSILCPAIIRDCKVPLEFSDVQAVRLVGRTPRDLGHPEWRRLIAAVERCVKRRSTFLGGETVSPIAATAVARGSTSASAAPAIMLGLTLLAVTAGAWVWVANPFGARHNAAQTIAAETAQPQSIDPITPNSPSPSRAHSLSTDSPAPVQTMLSAPLPAPGTQAAIVPPKTSSPNSAASPIASPAIQAKSAPRAPAYIAGRWQPPGGDCASPLVLDLKDNTILLIQTDGPPVSYRIRSATDYDIVAETEGGRLVQFDVDPNGMTYSTRRYTRCP